MTAKDKLAAVLQRAVLTASEREGLESVWDQMGRSGKASHKQKAWIERVYYGQKLDRPSSPATGTPPVRRRVVIPTWLKDQPQQRRAANVMQAPVPAAAVAPPVAAVEATGPGLVKTNASLIRRKSGQFRAVVQPSPVTATAKSSTVGYINYPVKCEERVTSL